MYTVSFILLLLIKILFVLFVVGLIGGIALAIKDYALTNEDIQKIKGMFTGKETCDICGNKLNKEWKVCPYCGREKEVYSI